MTQSMISNTGTRHTDSIVSLVEKVDNQLVNFHTLLLWILEDKHDLFEKLPARELEDAVSTTISDIKRITKKERELHKTWKELKNYKADIASNVTQAEINNATSVERDIARISEVIKHLEFARPLLDEFRSKLSELGSDKLVMYSKGKCKDYMQKIADIVTVLRAFQGKSKSIY